MAKKEITVETGVKLDNIMLKLNELEQLVKEYNNGLQKKTPGLKSLGDVNVEYADTCMNKANLYPEILPGTFDKDDFYEKMSATNGNMAILDKLDKVKATVNNESKVCKTDAMYYANEFYGLVKKEAKRNTKYIPVYNELEVYNRRSPKSDKTNTTTVNPNDLPLN